MVRAVFLDRDGTIARDVHYCSRPQDFELLRTVPEAVKLLNGHGFKVVVVTNQSGVARGYFTEATLSEIHRKMIDGLRRYGACVDAVYYCPHHPDDGCRCRKPGTALFRQAAGELGIDVARSYVVGDAPVDIEAGRALGSRTVLVTTGPGGWPDLPHPPDHTASNLLEAAEWILSDRGTVKGAASDN